MAGQNSEPNQDIRDIQADQDDHSSSGNQSDRNNPPVYDTPAFDAHHPNTRPKAPVTEGMPRPVNTQSNRNDVVVSTQALRVFDGNIQQLNLFVEQTRDSLALVDIRPGTFGAGGVLHGKVQVTLLGESLDFLKRVNETFIHLRTDIGELILLYDTAEEWNNLSVVQLNDVFRESFGDIKGYQRPDPGTGAGTNDGSGGNNPPVST